MAGSFLIVVLLSLPRFFIIDQVDCQFNGRVCPTEISNYLAQSLGKQSLFLNHREIETALKLLYPIGDISFAFSYPNLLTVKATGEDQAIKIKIFKTDSFPRLSLDDNSGSTLSAEFQLPSREIENFLVDKPSTESGLLSSGKFTQTNYSGETINLIVIDDLPIDEMESIYRLVSLAGKYLSESSIFVYGDRLFLSRPNLPDIIIYVSAVIAQVENSLQSIDYLDTIKSDAKVIDLSFKHPIIK